MVGAAVKLFVGATKGSQIRVGAVVGLVLETVTGIVLEALKRWLK